MTSSDEKRSSAARAGSHNGEVEVHRYSSSWRRRFAFIGPAVLISVGCMDPGNWATDIAAGFRFGYALLWALVVPIVGAHDPQ